MSTARTLALALALFAAGPPAAARADLTLLTRSGKAQAQAIAIAGGAGASHEEEVFIPSGEGPFTFDEAPAPAPATSSGDRGTARATAGAVFHAAASKAADGTLFISASSRASATAAVTDADPEVDNSSHFAEGSSLDRVSVSFSVTGAAAPYRLFGTATGSATFAELQRSNGTTIRRIEPGAPLFGAGGTLAPGNYQLVFESDIEVEAQAPGSHSADDSANGDVTLQVGLEDTDGDALPDTWETGPADTNADGTIDLDLPGMGADPRHKDLFVELDFMPPHRFDAAAAAQIVDAFADAPASNPDGNSGIALHLDNGADSVMNPKTGATWGPRTRQSSLVHQDVLGTVTGGDYDWTAFDDLRAVAFPQERRTAFRYAISAHGHDGRVSGVARGIPSSDLLVTLGAG
ncbi:MAG TPA: hypothetical protein VFN44_04060, partial [Solirubrobacteraceae bacterium]|nr:hypothetical protein [Solirubrobacteraceae bacterium]